MISPENQVIEILDDDSVQGSSSPVKPTLHLKPSDIHSDSMDNEESTKNNTYPDNSETNTPPSGPRPPPLLPKKTVVSTAKPAKNPEISEKAENAEKSEKQPKFTETWTKGSAETATKGVHMSRLAKKLTKQSLALEKSRKGKAKKGKTKKAKIPENIAPLNLPTLADLDLPKKAAQVEETKVETPKSKKSDKGFEKDSSVDSLFDSPVKRKAKPPVLDIGKFKLLSTNNYRSCIR